ncbi:MAG: fumarate lyase [Chloroflexi bacterium]|jgi:fumarate hydratase class II|nr:fumarate lyase [Chloroflexota bacterium]
MSNTEQKQANNAVQPGATRLEKDSIGELAVPVEAYYGVQTMRAIQNFPISGIPMPARFVQTHAKLKRAAAEVNFDLGQIDEKLYKAIAQAAKEIEDGGFADQFPIDIFQTGSGTSTNMNVNEVIASRANELLGGKPGDKSPVHPNDHVNMGQSSNDTIPTTLYLSALIAMEQELRPALKLLEESLRKKSTEFWDVIKTGRTHLQDATPIRLGQEFLGYAGQIERAQVRLNDAKRELSEVALGGTAVGTGVNMHPEFAKRVLEKISTWLGMEIRESDNHFQSQNAIDGAVLASGVMKTIAVSLMKISNDFRWMASGPRAGIGEIIVPAIQPGSSIMPGKVNPVVAESATMVAAQVFGYDTTITFAGQSGNFELNVMLPVAAYNLSEQIRLLANTCRNLAVQCVDGIVATDQGMKMLEQGLLLATPLAPVIGYDKTAAIVKKALKTNRTIREVATEDSGLPKDQLDILLDPAAMTEPGGPQTGSAG